MDLERRIIVQAIKLKDNTLVPIWDERIVFEKTEMYGNIVKLKGEFDTHVNLIECVYDIKTKKLEVGIELDIYPSEEDLEFKKGENVLFEKSHRVLGEAVISDVIFEEYDLTIVKGKKIDKYYLNRLNDIKIEKDNLYALKQWKPFYLLDNGKKIEWTHELYHKSK